MNDRVMLFFFFSQNLKTVSLALIPLVQIIIVPTSNLMFTSKKLTSKLMSHHPTAVKLEIVPNHFQQLYEENYMLKRFVEIEHISKSIEN